MNKFKKMKVGDIWKNKLGERIEILSVSKIERVNYSSHTIKTCLLDNNNCRISGSKASWVSDRTSDCDQVDSWSKVNF